MMKRNSGHLLLIYFISIMLGCERADEDDINPGSNLEPTLSSIQVNIFNLNCALSGSIPLPN